MKTVTTCCILTAICASLAADFVPGDVLMPDVNIWVQGRVPGLTVNLAAIQADGTLQAQAVGDYVVWHKPLGIYSPAAGYEAYGDPQPEEVELRFALSTSGDFCFGAKGPVPNVLAVVGTLFWHGPLLGVWDSVQSPTDFCWHGGRTYVDNGTFEPSDVGLAGMGYWQLRELQSKGYLTGLPSFDSDFRALSGIAIKHQFPKNLWILYYPVFVGQGDGGWVNPAELPMNLLWCQFASIDNNGTAVRSSQIQYVDALGSYVYCATYNNNGEQSWIKTDGVERIHQSNYGPIRRKYYNQYPATIELGGYKTWSEITPAVTVSVLAESMTVSGWTEQPSLGLRRNPPPDLLRVPPGYWTPVITAPPQSRIASPGETVVFEVTATGSAPLTYQWEKDGVVLAGKTDSSLLLENVQGNDSGSYVVSVVNPAASVKSLPASLKVVTCAPVVGMTRWWTAEGNSEDLISGEIGTIASPVTFEPGTVGQALKFGSGGIVRFQSLFPLHQPGDVTVEFWMKYPGSTEQAMMWTRQDSSDFNRFNINAKPPGTFRFDYRAVNGTLHASLGECSIPVNTWIHIGIVRAGNTYSTYCNGSLVYTKTDMNPSLPTATGWTMSGRNGFMFQGMLDEVTFYSRALSASELASIYAADGLGKCHEQNHPPVAQDQAVTVLEDTPQAIQLTGSDADQDPLSFIVVVGAAHGLLNGAPPALTYTPAANYFGPDSFTFKVNDGQVDSAPATVTITVTPINDAPTAMADQFELDEDTTLAVEAGAVFANDTDVDYDSLTATLVTGPVHGALVFRPDGGFSYYPTENWNGTDYFTYQVNDGVLSSEPAQVRLIVRAVNDPPTIQAGGPYSVHEGGSITVSASGYDPDGDVIQFAWDLNGDDTFETDGPTAQFSAINRDDGTIVIAVKATDSGGLCSIATAEVVVLNQIPVLGEIQTILQPVQINSEVTAQVAFTDDGTLDKHTAAWEWGDGISTPGTVSESQGSGVIAGTHVYISPGVYTVNVVVTDDDGALVPKSFQYVVVYDPNGGFVTGGGWIQSPAGAYAPNPALTGKASFGFVSKYQKGANIPTGQTQFQFKAADMNFQSDQYQWLVVAGAKAQYKGWGTINGQGDYGFMLTAIDGALPGGGGQDKFRIKIWDTQTETVIYDNQMNAELDADPTTVLGGGSIIIHP